MGEKIASLGRFFIEVFRITKDELKRIFNDVGVLLLFVGATVVYPLIYSYVYNPEVVKDVNIAVVNNDNGGLSRQLTRMIDATQEVKVQTVTRDMAEARKLFYTGKVKGIVVVDRDFTRSIYRGEQGVVSVFSDASYFMFYKQVLSGVNYAGGTLGAGIQVQRLMARGLRQEYALEKAQSVKLISAPLYNPSGGYGSYAMPAILILVLQQTLLMGVGMLGGTRKEKGAFHYMAPFANKRSGAIQMVTGKGLTYFLFYQVVAFYLYVVVFEIFDFPHKADLGHLFFFLLPFVLSVVFMALFLSTFFKNRENSMMFLLFTAVPLLFLSGFSWPYEAFPVGLEQASWSSPATHAIRGFLKLQVMGAPFEHVKGEWLALWGLTLIYFILAAWRFKGILKKACD